MPPVSASLIALTAFVFLIAAANVRAASPMVNSIMPRGGQRGQTLEIVFGGQRLKDAVEVLFHGKGISSQGITSTDDRNAKAKLTIAPDAPLGEHLLRLRCKTGISHVYSFWVGPFPNVKEKEPNSEFESPQPIDMNVTVYGQIAKEDVDYFVFEAKKGQRISAEVEGMRLAGSFFDPYIAILDSRRFELMSSDDTALLLQDGVASVVAPEDGPYVVMVRDAAYEGDGRCRYRLHVGTFPRPLAVFPAGGPKGTNLDVTYIGHVDEAAAKQTLSLPNQRIDKHPVFCMQGDITAPSANWIRVSNFGNAFEVEPNDKREEATVIETPLPVAFNGIISEPDDVDFYRFKMRKGQYYHITVFARSLRSPLDSVVSIFAVGGKRLAGDDDSIGPDSHIGFKAPDDGEYELRITDHLRGGGPHYVYRIEFLPNEPKIDLTFPFAAPRDWQSLQMVAVPQGNRFATMVNVARDNFQGDLNFEAPDLPKGMTLHTQTSARGLPGVPVVFEAAPDAEPQAHVIDFIARGADEESKNTTGRWTQTVSAVRGANDTGFYDIVADNLAVGVIEAVPFSVDIVPPTAPLVQSGEKNLRIKVTRDEGFTKEVTVRMLWKPPGIGAKSSITIPGDQTEGDYPLSADAKAKLETWKIAISGESNHGGKVTVGSQLTELTVAEPFVNATINMAAIEQGKDGEVFVELEQHTAFDGEATVALIGLPHDATTGEMKITKESKQVVFPIKTTGKTPIGTHKNLLCRITVTHANEPVVHNVGRGGVLRIDKPAPPEPAKTPEVTKPAAPKPKPVEKNAEPEPVEKKPVKPLTRLEKIRLEAKRRAEKEAGN